MVKLIGSVLLAAGLVASASASAGTYNLNTLPSGLTTFSETVSPGSFSDTVDFTLSKLSKLGAGVGSTSISIFGTSLYSISGLNVAVYNSHNVELGSGTDVTLNSLQSGNYYAVITGKATGVAGGLYSGAFSVSAVPESSTWGMLAVGLGLLGYTASRRKV